MAAARRPRFDATVLGAATLFALALGNGNSIVPYTEHYQFSSPKAVVPTSYVGAWRSADAAVRLDLEAYGSYERGIVGRTRTTHGTYRAEGANLLLRDDSGLLTTVTVTGDVLHLAGYRLVRTAAQ